MEWGLGIATTVQHIIFLILYPIFAYFYRKKPPSLPKLKNPLLKLSAVALAKKIREGEISSKTVVEAFIERIKEVNPFVNAVIEDRFEAAINDAITCDEKLKTGKVNVQTLEKEQPLYGVPFTVKESCSLKGLSHTGCTLIRQGVKASVDSPAVETLKEAGGIPLCVTNTPELCSSFNTSNLLFGTTSNPHDTRYTAGGSSGGEGALLGAGASLIGVGSDIAGSIRIPAHFNGVFGHKPTPGIIPIKEHFPMSKNPIFQQYLVMGPLAKYAEDLHLAVKVMSSKCGKDLRLDDPVDTKKLRVFYLDNLESFMGSKSTTSDVREIIKKATDFLSESGATVQQLSKGWFEDTYYMALSIFFGLDDAPILLANPNDPKHEKSALCEFAKSLFGQSQYTRATMFMKLLFDSKGLIPSSRQEYYQKAAEDLRQKLNELLRDDAIFIYPTYPRAAFLKQLMCLKADYSAYCLPVNILQLPSTHVPMGLNSKGLPIGFQVIAASHQDRLCLAVAKELEKKFGGWVPPTES